MTEYKYFVARYGFVPWRKSDTKIITIEAGGYMFQEQATKKLYDLATAYMAKFISLPLDAWGILHRADKKNGVFYKVENEQLYGITVTENKDVLPKIEIYTAPEESVVYQVIKIKV